MPDISVLMPARNAAATVRRAVTSTLRDLPRDAEVVVLDDASTDGTAAALSDVVDARLRILSHAGAGGLGAKLNHLLQTTDSRLVARMDADDVTLRGRFGSGLGAVEAGAHFTFTSVVTQRSWRLAPSSPQPIPAAAFPFHLLVSNPVRHPSMLARRDALTALDGYRDLPAEDYDLWLRAAGRGHSMVKTGWFGLRYRVHAHQVTASSDWQRRSHADPQLAAAFRTLSVRLVGQPLPRLVSLYGRDDDGPAALAEFSQALLRAIAHLPPAQQFDLIRKLRKRQRLVTQTWTSAATLTRGGVR
jgi:Glycosyl transferase family 2